MQVRRQLFLPRIRRLEDYPGALCLGWVCVFLAPRPTTPGFWFVLRFHTVIVPTRVGAMVFLSRTANRTTPPRSSLPFFHQPSVPPRRRRLSPVLTVPKILEFRFRALSVQCFFLYIYLAIFPLLSFHALSFICFFTISFSFFLLLPYPAHFFDVPPTSLYSRFFFSLSFNMSGRFFSSLLSVLQGQPPFFL